MRLQQVEVLPDPAAEDDQFGIQEREDSGDEAADMPADGGDGPQRPLVARVPGRREDRLGRQTPVMPSSRARRTTASAATDSSSIPRRACIERRSPSGRKPISPAAPRPR